MLAVLSDALATLKNCFRPGAFDPVVELPRDRYGHSDVEEGGDITGDDEVDGLGDTLDEADGVTLA